MNDIDVVLREAGVHQAVATRLDGDWMADTAAVSGYQAVLNVVGLADPDRFELVVDGAVRGQLPVEASGAERCGFELAAALLERQQAGDCAAYELRLWAWDDDVAAELLVAEWRCP